MEIRKVVGAPRAAWKTVVKYTTDGCSGVPDFNFRDCCVQHDYDYAEHHRESEGKRLELDKKLRLCIGCRGHKVLAWIYWVGVRAFGWISYWVKERRERLTVEEDMKKNGYSRPELEEKTGGKHADLRD